MAMMLFPPTPTFASPYHGHHIERPYACPEPGCFHRFKRKFTLKEHIKTHTGEKPFVCPVKSCGKTFTTSANLARHKRLHPWLKPLVCLVDGCDRSFSNEVKLERHMKTHFKRPRVLQTCPMAHCGKQFSTTGNLTRHLKQQHHELSLPSFEEPLAIQHQHHHQHHHHGQDMLSPCAVNTGIFSLQSLPTDSFVHCDGSRAFNPLMNEISDVKDEELLETLQCLF
jgi:hypothetical protein